MESYLLTVSDEIHVISRQVTVYWKKSLLTVVSDNTEKSCTTVFSCKFGVLLENNFAGDTYTAIPATEETTRVFTKINVQGMWYTPHTMVSSSLQNEHCSLIRHTCVWPICVPSLFTIYSLVCDKNSSLLNFLFAILLMFVYNLYKLT